MILTTITDFLDIVFQSIYIVSVLVFLFFILKFRHRALENPNYFNRKPIEVIGATTIIIYIALYLLCPSGVLIFGIPILIIILWIADKKSKKDLTQ